jgi:hypothetical protein
MGETLADAPDSNYHYRVRYPDEPGSGYRSEMFVQKFERDFFGNYLEYVFVQAYPIAIASMPISYNASELLKCTVSFTYNRYYIRNRPNIVGSEPSQQTPAGIPNPLNQINSNSVYNLNYINEPDIYAPGGAVERAIGPQEPLF